MRHDDEAVGGDFAREDAHAESGVGFVLEVLKEGADFCFVGFLGFGAEFAEGGFFDGGGDGDDCGGGDGGSVGEAIVEEADAVVAGGLVGAGDRDTIFLVIALVGRDDRSCGFG